MDSVLTGQPVTPSRAKSAGPRQQHLDPMEDADSPSTRKRPRLDSGERVYRSMSADPSGAGASHVEAAKAAENSLDTEHPSQPLTTDKELPPTAVTPSKVTINVREPLDQTSPVPDSAQINGVSSIRGGDGHVTHPAGHPESSSNMESSSSKAISVSSSPSHSLEIEVAEVEDMNDDPGETRWKRLESTANTTTVQEAKDTQGALLDQFPHASGMHTLKKTISLIAGALEKNDLGDGDLLDNLAAWIESYLQTTEPLVSQWWDMIQDERDFWDDVPSLVEALMHRSHPRSGTIKMLCSNNGDMLDGQSPLQNFLVAYSSLTLRMARMDYHILVGHSEGASTLVELISERYLIALSNVMNYNYSFWKHLVDVSCYDCKITITAMMNRFIQPPEDGIALMISLSKEILDRSQKMPGLIHKFFGQIAVVNRLVQHYHTLQQSVAEVDEELAALFDGVTNQSYELFQLVDGKFQDFISKQVPALSIDVSQGFVKQLSMLLRNSVASDDQLLQKVTVARTLPTRGLDKEDSAHLVELAWKLETLKKCIFDGRMEIRVQGVDTMQQELVSVYNKFINNSSSQKDHTIPQYLSDFMLANKLVDYFVGIESHPQLVHRCANIIGFLLVTNRYTEAQTDTIWRAVTNSQDSRFIEAILGMLPNIFGIASYPVLLHLTVKLNELPIIAFDGSVITYAHSLLDYLRRMWRYEPNNPKMDMPPYHLCIRLIRQVAVEKSLDTPRRRHIHQFAAAELGWFLPFGPSDGDRRLIYQECIQDISDRNQSATGSVSSINTLLMQNPEKEFASVTREWNLAQLVIGEFSHKIKTEKSSDVSSLVLQESLDTRMSLIQNIILFVPDTITIDVGTRLWDYAVGSEALSYQTREIAWLSCFLSVIRKISNRNCYIDQCVREHLPRLQPRFYTPGCLHFAQDVSHYHFRSAAIRPQDGVKQETTAEDLLWHMSLTALPGTIERRAITMLVALYLDSPENTRRTRAAIEAIHVGVVERCVRQLTSAASRLKSFSDGTSSGEDEPMVIVASEDEVQTQRLSFSRSLTILKEFLWGVRARPKYSPQLQTQPRLPYELREAKGDTVQIRYQAFGSSAAGEIRTVEVGNLETMQELASQLKLLTGFSKFTLISGGQRLDLGKISTKTLRELRLDQKGLVLVKRDLDAQPAPGLAQASGLRPVEAEILTHFHDLYPLLGMEEKLAKEMFEFLLAFPAHNSITALVCSDDTPLETIFPPSAPFKILYSTNAFKQCLVARTQNAPTSRDLTIHGIRSLTQALTMLSFSIGPQGAGLDITVAAHLLECLNQFLKEPTYFAGTESLFLNPSALLHRLQTMINESLAVDENVDADVLASASFAAILKISLHVDGFWEEFKNANVCSTLLRRLVLDEPNAQLRCRAADYVRSICNDLNLTPTTPAQAFIPYLWESIVTIIPHCLEAEGTSQEFFELTTMIFKCIDHSYRNTLDLGLYVQNWSVVLLRHKHDEYVGRESVDWLVNGLSTLLHWVFQYAKSVGKALSNPDDLLINLFHTHLFPPLPDFYEPDSMKARLPVLHSATRQELYSIILVLSNEIDDYKSLLIRLKGLCSQSDGSHGWSWGFAQTSEDYPYDQNWSIERNKTIRSPTGYPGMRNLSNTCYMNSLFTQLFMNVKFRGFMLGMNVADGGASQKLLLETQTLFGYMQDTMLRSVDSQGIVESLVTYDNTLIDVSVQMDVDEFYNLLFDRWEGQILLAADKKTFREFYGGQIVQQIKSKECPHISERLEPFSAIQCDIHGKATLMDSLNAYVSGETMEGDNKYSCTSCGCYVDAVKRACLKEIPDNLIFHLKRFDYDVMTGMRSKINDAFEFPHQIDMAPYHIDYQKDTSSPCAPDMFELVGVLVHSGTAESGHYYSYIRERPPVLGGAYNWVEFNDMDVTKFDPNNIADQCFGGYSEATHYAHRFQKNWNAYMLFYERTEPRSSNEVALSRTPGVPAKCAVPPEIERQIASSNAQFLRNYCLYDPAHAIFARRFLEQLRDVNQGVCSENHIIEKEAIWLSLDYLERVLSRSKDCSDFSKMLASLTKVIGTCAICCKLALDWVKLHEHVLRDLLLRCPNPKVRKEFASMVVIALKHLKKYEPQWYGFQDSVDGDCESSVEELHPLGIFPHIASRLSELWTVLPSHARGWDDYFGLLTELVNLGIHEAHILLNRGFLRNCLELLVVDHVKASRFRSETPHYSQYCRLLDKGRRFCLKNLIEFLASLLERIDLGVEWVLKTQERQFSPQGMQLTRWEDELMHMGSEPTRPKNLCIFLEKVLSSGSNNQAARKIVKIMTLAEPQFGMHEHIQKTITGGINIEPAHLAEPYLEAALSFCEATHSEDNARDMIRYVAGEVDTIGDKGGAEHLKFFAQARRIVSLRNGPQPGFFNRTVLRTVPQWAPALLHYNEEPVRIAAVDLLKLLVFNYDIRAMDDEEHAELIETAARDLQVACTRRCSFLVQSQKHVDAKIVEQTMLVIRYCLDNYYSAEEDQRLITEADNVLTALEVLTISDIDEAASEVWNNASDDVPTDSEDEFLTNSP